MTIFLNLLLRPCTLSFLKVTPKDLFIKIRTKHSSKTLLSVVRFFMSKSLVLVKSKMEISRNFVAFSEYLNFTKRRQKIPFLTPPLTPTSAHVIYEWSPRLLICLWWL